MTLEQILRSKNKRGGCTAQNKYVWEERCIGCKTKTGASLASIDNYKLDERLKAFEKPNQETEKKHADVRTQKFVKE